MDEETEALLEKSNLSEYVSVFKHNRIGISDIRCITSEQLSVLIEPLGDRWRFLRAVESYSRDVTQSETSVKKIRTSLRDAVETPSKDSSIEYQNIGGNQKVDTRDEFETESDLISSDDENIQPKCSANSSVRVTYESPASRSTSSQQSTRRPLEESQSGHSSTCNSANSSSISESSRNTLKNADDLKEYLSWCADGRTVLKVFEVQKTLTDFARTTLTAVVLDKLLVDHNNKLRNKDIDAAANWICEIFPSESPLTYYIAPFSEGQKQSISKGKLPYRYRNRRRSLEKHGLISPKKSQTAATKISISRDQLVVEDSFIEAKTWLAHYSEPWTQVLRKWTQTAPNRLQQLQTELTATLQDILKDWPILKHPLGYTLITVDFNCAYPENCGKLLSRWCTHRDKLLQVMISRPKKDKQAALHSIRDLNDDSTDACKDATIMYLIPALLPPTILRNGKKTRKPTIAESQEAFMIHAKTAADIEVTLAARRKKYEKLGLSIQPCVVIVGSSLANIDNSYVIVDNVRWRLNDPLAAVDVCFQLFHVLNLEYPAEALNPWMFLQRFFYEIKTKFDKVSCSVTALISEL